MDIYERVTQFYRRSKTPKQRIGKSVFGRTVYAMKVGNGRPVGIATYAIHGREYITAELALAQIRRGVQKGSCWFIPLVNPDGALLSQIGLSSVLSPTEKARLIALNGGEDFSLWKANARGVDLNVNFPARWGEGVKNVRTAGRENYIGNAPLSEPETQALSCFTQTIRPDYTVSYHTKGEEIYWRFHQTPDREARDRRLGETLSKTTGYPLKETKGSVGGYKDWCIQTFQIPAFTVEVGKDELAHPLKGEALEDILKKNEWAIYALSGKIP